MQKEQAKWADSDCVYITAYVRALEADLLGRADLALLVASSSPSEVAAILSRHGYPDMTGETFHSMASCIQAEFAERLRQVEIRLLDPSVVRLIRLKFDAHNIKTLLKSRGLGTSADALLMDVGTIPVATLKDDFPTMNFSFLGQRLAHAVLKASEALNRTRDPQVCESFIDRWYFEALLVTADRIGDVHITNSIRLLIDFTNLKILVRARKLGMNPEAFKLFFIPQGSFDFAPYADKSSTLALAEHLSKTTLASVATFLLPENAHRSMTEFELVAYNTQMAYLRCPQMSRRASSAAVLTYLRALESEVINILLILSAKHIQLSAEDTLWRIRDPFGVSHA